jgi:hypothetical protein
MDLVMVLSGYFCFPANIGVAKKNKMQIIEHVLCMGAHKQGIV